MRLADRGRSCAESTPVADQSPSTMQSIVAGWPAFIRNTRNIRDFRRWKTHDVYQKAFDRLLRDLKAVETKP